MFYLSENLNNSDIRRNSQQIIKSTNLRWLFQLINQNKRISRAALVRMTHLSPTTVSVLVDELVRNGLVREVGPVTTRSIGRKPTSLVVRADGQQIPVFSLSRWGVRYTLYDLRYEEKESYFVSYLSDQYGGFDPSCVTEPDSGSDYIDIITDILKNHAPLLDWKKVSCICISQPGIYIEHEKRIACSALKTSIRCEEVDKLESRFGVPILVGNSSMAFAYAEKKYLNYHGQKIHDLIYLNVTDGIGAGIVYQDEIFTGMYNTAGELGHMLFQAEPNRAGGKLMSLEDAVNTHLVVQRVREALQNSSSTEMMDLVDPQYNNLSLEVIGEAYSRQVQPVCQVLDDIAEKLYLGIYNVICITGIRQIVIGGGIERLGPAFREKLVEIAEAYPKSPVVDEICISYTQSGFKGDSVGLAEYYIDKHFLFVE